MYKIGEFSKITSLTVKALRYYEEQGILCPSERDKNGYRLYNDSDYERARLIVLLRELDFSIMEIRDVIANYGGEEDLAYFLKEKQAQILQRISGEKALLKKLEEALPGRLAGGYVKQEYAVRVQEEEEVTVVSIRFRGAYSDVGKYIGRLYKAAGNKASGCPFSLYYDEEYREDADVELCLPVKGMVQVPGISCRKLPGCRTIRTIHQGSYEELGYAYKALLDAAFERKLRPEAPSREIYTKGPGLIFRGNPSHYLTELAIPVRDGGALPQGEEDADLDKRMQEREEIAGKDDYGRIEI